MSDLSLNRRSLVALGSLAANTGDEALQTRVEELKELSSAPVLHAKGKSTPAMNGALRTFVETVGDKRKRFIPVLKMRQLLKKRGGRAGDDMARLLLDWVFDANVGRHETGRWEGYKTYAGFGEKTLTYLAKTYELLGIWIDAIPAVVVPELIGALRHVFYAFSVEQNPHKAAHYMDEADPEDVLDAHRLGNALQTQAWARQAGFPEAVFLDRLGYVIASEPQRTLAVLDVTIGLNERAMAYMVKKLFMENCIQAGSERKGLLAILRDGDIPAEAGRAAIDYVLHVMEIYRGQPALSLEFWQEIISALLMRGVLRGGEDVCFREGVRANGFNIGGGEGTAREKDIWHHLSVLGFRGEDGPPTRDAAKKERGKLAAKYHEDRNPNATEDEKKINKERYQAVVEAWRFVEGKLPK